jgi:hypothetical protein
VGQLSLWDGHENDNEHGTAQNGSSRLVEPVRDFTSPLRPPMSRIYDPTARRSDTLGSQKLRVFRPSGVSQYGKVNPSLNRTKDDGDPAMLVAHHFKSYSTLPQTICETVCLRLIISSVPDH